MRRAPRTDADVTVCARRQTRRPIWPDHGLKKGPQYINLYLAVLGMTAKNTDTQKTVQKLHAEDTRFYEAKFPEVEDLVMVKIKQVSEMGAYCTLIEYGTLEGMILLSELSKRRVRSTKKIVRVGRLEVVMVLRVDADKGYIDLSKKRVSEEDITMCEDRYNRSKKVHQIMFHVAQKHGIPLVELNRSITWVLQKKYDHPLTALRSPDFSTSILPTLDVSDAVKKTLLEIIDLRLSSQRLHIRAGISLYCYGYAGVDAIRDALSKGKEVLEKDGGEVEIKLIAPPQYSIVIYCNDRAEGEQRLRAGIQEIMTTIAKYEGGDGSQQKAFVVMGGDDDVVREEASDNENKSHDDSSSGSDDDSEDETMGRADETMKKLGMM